METDFGRELAVALEAVTAASRLCVAVQADLRHAATLAKADRSPVTVADFGSQAVMALVLADAFAGDPMVGEEDSRALRGQPAMLERVRVLVSAEVGEVSTDGLLAAIDRAAAEPRAADRFWVMDPVDGTKGFLRGEQFAVALALVAGGEVVAGVLGCPNYPLAPALPPGGMFYAVQGRGAFLRPSGGGADVPLTTGDGQRRARRLCESVESAHAAHETHRRIADKLGITSAPFRIDSQAKYAAIARGDADIYLRLPRDGAYREKIWDHAAGSILVAEAGGCVSDFEGRPLNFAAGRHLANPPGLLACARDLHRPALQAVREVVARCGSPASEKKP